VLIASKGQILLAAPSSCQGVSKKLPMISFSSFIIGRLSNASRFLSSLILLSMICLEGRNPQLTWDLNSTLELSLCQGLFSDKITDVLFQHRYSFSENCQGTIQKSGYWVFKDLPQWEAKSFVSNDRAVLYTPIYYCQGYSSPILKIGQIGFLPILFPFHGCYNSSQ
jgi:hypothetical protein